MKNLAVIFLLLLFLQSICTGAKEDINKQDINEFREKLNRVKSQNIADKNIKKGYIETFSDRYIVSPGDVINVSVFGEPDLTQREILVKCDGYVNFHPVGEIKVAGFNVDEVKQILTENLRTFFVDPIISVYINNPHVPKIFIYGAVQNPGLFRQNHDSQNRLKTPVTLTDVIAHANGIKYNADLENVEVTNTKTNTKRTFNLLNLIKNGDLSQDVYLSSGDRVYIPAKNTNAQMSDKDFLLLSSSHIAPKEFPVRVRGAVQSPGVHYLNSVSPGINTALAASKGFTIDAKIDAVKIQRVTPQGNLSTIVVNPYMNDMVLRPNDIISVLDKRRTVLGKGIRFFDKIASYLSKFGSAFNQWNYAFDPETEHNVYLK